MPNRNKRGPLGEGPMTGKRMGLCVDNRFIENNPVSDGYGFGYGRRGRGMGFRHGFGYTHQASNYPNSISDETILENEIRILKDQLTSVEKQLSELKNDEK